MSLQNIISLPTYSLTLPSGTNIKFRPFVVKEEKLLLLAKESKDINKIYECIRNIVKCCVIEPEQFDIENCPFFDVQYLFLILRCKSMGEEVSIRVTDPETKDVFDTTMDLEKIEIEGMTDMSKSKKMVINDSLAIEYKYPVFSDILKLQAADSIQKLIPNNNETQKGEALIDILINLSSICISKVYVSDRVIDCSALDSSEIINFITSLPRQDFIKYCNFYNTLPKITYKSEFTNPKTGNAFPVEVTDFTNFFIL